jgi:hypothetical protein
MKNADSTLKSMEQFLENATEEERNYVYNELAKLPERFGGFIPMYPLKEALGKSFTREEVEAINKQRRKEGKKVMLV